ncbi:MAG: hypothetical protein K0V04_06060 [Deltaproteobacteria bacterium]|nr:hypothetical protein [Deltaproteobacteria bacterium]
METLLRPLSIITVLALTTNCVATSDDAPLSTAKQDQATESEGSTLLAVIDAPDSDPDRSAYEVRIPAEGDNPIDLVGLDLQGKAVSRLHAEGYFDEDGEPYVAMTLNDEDFAFDGHMRLKVDDEGQHVLQVTGTIRGHVVSLRLVVEDPAGLMVYGFEGLPPGEFVPALESDFFASEDGRQLLDSLGRFSVVQGDLAELALTAEDTAFRASASCVNCLFQVGAIVGGSVACLAAIAALSVCAGGPITAPACLAVIGAIGGACGSTSAVMGNFYDSCEGACAVEGPEPDPFLPDCI